MLMAAATKNIGSKFTRFMSSAVSTPKPGKTAQNPIPKPIIEGEIPWAKSVSHRAIAVSVKSAAFCWIGVHDPIFLISSRT